MKIRSNNTEHNSASENLIQSSITPQEIYDRHGELLAHLLDTGEVGANPNDYRKFVVRAMRIEQKDGITYELDIVQDQTDHRRETSIMLIDENLAEELVGYGVIAHIIGDKQRPQLNNKPFVGYTETVDKYRRQGYGERRLILMNMLSKQLFDQPLESDLFGMTESEASMTWQKLARSGIAEEISTSGVPRWRFID